jgi:hypothetical protein
MPKGERLLSPKQKDRTTTNLKKFQNKILIDIFHIGIYVMAISQLVSISIDVFSKLVFDVNWYPCFTCLVKAKFQLVSNLQLILQLVSFQFSNWYLFQKPSWKLRAEFHSGGVLFSQRKSIWNKGRNFKSWKCFLQSYSYTFDYLQKDLEKISKIIYKNKTSGASVVQNIKQKKAIHSYLVKSLIGLIPSNLCTYHIVGHLFSNAVNQEQGNTIIKD